MSVNRDILGRRLAGDLVEMYMNDACKLFYGPRLEIIRGNNVSVHNLKLRFNFKDGRSFSVVVSQKVKCCIMEL